MDCAKIPPPLRQALASSGALGRSGSPATRLESGVSVGSRMAGSLIKAIVAPMAKKIPKTEKRTI